VERGNSNHHQPGSRGAEERADGQKPTIILRETRQKKNKKVHNTQVYEEGQRGRTKKIG